MNMPGGALIIIVAALTGAFFSTDNKKVRIACTAATVLVLAIGITSWKNY